MSYIRDLTVIPLNRKASVHLPFLKTAQWIKCYQWLACLVVSHKSETEMRCAIVGHGNVSHDMEMLSALLALCEGNPPVTGGFPSQRASNVKLHVLFPVSLTKLLNKQSSCLWIFFVVRLSKLLNKLCGYWWFEMPYRLCVVTVILVTGHKSEAEMRCAIVCHGNVTHMTWRCRGMGMISAARSLCEGNPPVSGRFSSQRTSNVEQQMHRIPLSYLSNIIFFAGLLVNKQSNCWLFEMAYRLYWSCGVTVMLVTGYKSEAEMRCAIICHGNSSHLEIGVAQKV